MTSLFVLISGKAEVLQFLDEHKLKIFENVDEHEAVGILRSKVFNERKKHREAVKKRIMAMSV